MAFDTPTIENSKSAPTRLRLLSVAAFNTLTSARDAKIPINLTKEPSADSKSQLTILLRPPGSQERTAQRRGGFGVPQAPISKYATIILAGPGRLTRALPTP